MRITLASASPRRKELLARVVPSFDVVPSHCDESVNLSLFPEHIARNLAESKCDDVYSRVGGLVIGCDTIVVLGDDVLGKPKDEEDAKRTLAALSGKTHYVITGVCVRSPLKKLVKSESTEVRFNLLSEKFIDDYVASGSPMDKAGSYGIQDEGVVREYFGSYTNVVGMPVALVRKMIEEVLKDDTVGN